MSLKLEGMVPLLQVFDMPQSIAFYRDVLGFEVVTSSPQRGQDDFDWGLLKLDDIELMLNRAFEPADQPMEPDPSRFAAHDDTALFFGCRDVDAAYADLWAKGIDVTPPREAPYGMRQIHLKDPDGYAICLQSQR